MFPPPSRRHVGLTILLTNRHHVPVKRFITRYAHGMLIENAQADAVRFIHRDGLSSAVGRKVDFDITQLVLAIGLFPLPARQM